MRPLFWMIVLLWASWVSPIWADECETKAREIAAEVGLDAGKRSAANVFPLSARTEDEDAYGAYLLCNGSLGMTLQFLSPPFPARKWFEFVGRSGAILTEVNPATMALEAQNCVENAGMHDGFFQWPGSAFKMICSIDRHDARAELYLAAQ